MFIETKRLYLREMDSNDEPDVKDMLQNVGIMYAYEHEFSDEDVREWIDKNKERYQEQSGMGLMAIVLKETDQFIGQAGLNYIDLNDKRVIDITYLLKKEFWNKGYAIEAARALANYAFDIFKVEKLYARIRFDNYPSKNVATRLGMKPTKTFNVTYYNNDIPHDLYEVDKEVFIKTNNI